jgi:hypothetical protein
MKTYKNVDEYIKNADKDRQKVLLEMREIVTDNFKSTEEEISYGMPAYKYKGKPFFYFAAMKGHLGLYPTPGPILTLQKICGGGEIRTHGPITQTPVFKTGAIDHSATPPCFVTVAIL